MKWKLNRRVKHTCVHQNVQFVLADSQPRLHFESRLEGSFCDHKLYAGQDM